jgi:hypothetical protein
MNRYGVKKILSIFAFSLVIVIILGYIYFAFRDYIKGPYIEIYEPINGYTTSSSTIKISGKALRIKDIMLNGRPLLIDTEGNFNEILLLSPGYNVSLMNATDKFNRTIEYKLELVYKKD